MRILNKVIATIYLHVAVSHNAAIWFKVICQLLSCCGKNVFVILDGVFTDVFTL